MSTAETPGTWNGPDDSPPNAAAAPAEDAVITAAGPGAMLPRLPPARYTPGTPPAEAPPTPPEDPGAAPPLLDEDGTDVYAGRHIHHVVSVRLGATADAIFVSRTETLIEHRHAPLERDPEDDLWDEHARALGLARPRPAPRLPPAEPGEPGAPPARSHLPGPRDAAHPAGPEVPVPAGFLSFGSKSRLPVRMTRAHLEAYLKQERRIALEARDPVAIRFAAERYNTILDILAEWPAGETLDLFKPLLTVSQAAKILGYNAKEVRRLLGQGKINGRKVGSEWRLPLRAVL